LWERNGGLIRITLRNIIGQTSFFHPRVMTPFIDLEISDPVKPSSRDELRARILSCE
jgi:hypothetical protein